MHYYSLLSLLLLTAVAASPLPQPPTAKLQFNRDVRPILSEHCFACHGPDKAKRQGKLRLDERDSAITRKAIVPGKPSESKLIARIHSEDETEVMPPPEMHKPLSAAQKKVLAEWITQGAEYQAHWAYIVPTRPAVPAVKNTAWVKNPIDAFILATLEAKGIAPSSQADRATLLRRVSIDLTGLPPTWEEVQATLTTVPPEGGTPTQKWYEQAVDRLLASPHFGERLAVHWLDLVRFADTVGYHGDQNQRIFPYRDYVIDAFNNNMPFDQFTREQIAGDLLPNATVQQKIASGFNRLNMMTREGGAQPAEYLTKYAADRVRTVAGTWLGCTVGCAECHDHKYDPFTSKDFYSLAAYFGDIKQWGVYNDYSYTPNPDLKGWSNDHPFPPEIEVESKYLQQRMATLKQQMEQVAGPAGDALTKWKTQLAAWNKTHGGWWMTPAAEVGFGAMPAPKKKAATKPAEKKKDNAAKAEKKTDEKPKPMEKADVQVDGSIVFSGPTENAPKISLKLPAGPIALVKLELLGSEGKSILRTNSNSLSFKPTFELRRAGEEKAKPIAIRHADADCKEPIYRNGHDLIGIRENWKLSLKARYEKHISLWWLDQPFTASADDELIVSIPTNQLRHIKLSVSPYAPLDFMPEGQPEFTTSSHLRSTAYDATRHTELKRLEREYHECRQGKTMTMVTEALAKPAITRVLPRGNFLDQTGPVVPPAPPSFLQAKVGTSRLDLANWLVAKDNPLTARVVVNRFWKMLFGNGLSNVLDDLGAQGEWPTHPELLDWLAVEFRESGWNVKYLLKLMVMSNTYRQSAVTRKELKEIDPNNRLLAAQNPRRLDAEFVRDQALAVAGLLNRDLGGPSSFPYQPANYYSLLQFPDRDYKAQLDDRQYRRGLYTHWQRMFPQPMLTNFDAPSREECTACRVVANTPQQALTLLNDPTFVEAARVLASSIMKMQGSDEVKLATAIQRVLQREPKPKELAGLVTLLGKQREYYRSQPAEANALLKVGLAPLPTSADAVELAAWTNTVRVLFNLHETITRY